ncbi:MAG: cupin domain-containing protein [Acidimicrobiia bacterium]|nr:cupin domain-containing protein [Acidimicrobiia bacterium]
MSPEQPPDPATHFPDLITQVDIPSQGTLSRVLYKDETIRLVVFAFDAGQELTDHTSRHAAIAQVLEGEIELVLAGNPVVMAPGAWVHMPPQLPHAVRALEPTVMVLTLLMGGTENLS